MRGLIFETYNSLKTNVIGPFYRKLGKRLYVSGVRIEGDNASEDRLVPSLRRLNYSGVQPNLQGADFIAPNATIIGNVTVGINSSIWYGATLIGTQNINIGNNCVIQDRAHLSKQVKIGNDVFVGPNAIIQGSQLQDWSFVSMGSTVRHAKVESGGLVAAGAVIPDNVVIKEGQIWAGNPGKFLRNISGVERQILREHLEQMRDLAIIHDEQAEKNPREVISGRLEPFESNCVEDFLENLYDTEYNLEYSDIDEQFMERRTYMREESTQPELNKDYEPYEYNYSHMGQKFNIGTHNQQFNKVATKIKAKERFDNDTDPWVKPF